MQIIMSYPGRCYLPKYLEKLIGLIVKSNLFSSCDCSNHVNFKLFFQSHKIDIRTKGGKVIGLGTLCGNTDIHATEKGVSKN